MKRRAALLCSALALTAAAPLSAAAPLPVAAAGPSGAGAEESPSTALHRQRLDWGTCVEGPDDSTGNELEKAGAQCAEATVPLDHDDPAGRTITVAISRIPATDEKHRLGAVLLNGGGPGGATLGDPPWVRKAMREVGSRYDVVGVDPRFVGRSTPLDCSWPTGSAIRGAGTGRAGFDRATAFAKELADRCRKNAGSVLPYATTRNTARDMDIIRAALGEEKISYLGYSYGSYLGEVYATMFPRRVDRMVLDGVIDPEKYSPNLLRSAESANRHALRDWAAWAAARNGTYGLGSTGDRVVRAVEDLRRAAAREPLVLGRYRLDAHTMPLIVFNGLSQDTDAAYGALARAVQDMRTAAQGRPVEPDPALDETLGFLLTGSESTYGSAQSAILCGDVPAPRNPETYWKDIRRSPDRLFGPVTRNIGPCAFWDAPREAPTEVTDDFPALLVNATGDPRTTYEGAVAQRRNWPASRLVTLKGAEQHAVYGVFGNSCVDDQVNSYLTTGRLPGRDVTCPADGPGDS